MTPKESLKALDEKPNAIASLLLFVALREARRYKWERSCAAGKDLGDEKVLEWFHKNWTTWYRDHWVEHLLGRKFWDEFGKEEFDILSSYPDQTLLKDITEHVARHGENLGIIMWAEKSGQDMKQVLGLLAKMDINAKRAETDDQCIKMLAKAMDEADKYKWIQSEKAGRDLGDAAFCEWFAKYWAKWYQDTKDSV